jgi:RimJ/RimL family protein N-acetyltransferase
MPDVSFTELAGQRVALRRFRLGDVAGFVAYRSSVEVARYQSWDAPYPLEQGERCVRQMMERHPDTAGEWFQFAVELRETGQLVGDCAAMPHASDPSQCEIGFTIAAEHQGHGYATEAVRLLVGYLFTARGKHRVTACCDARNAASAAVLERLAMRREGHLRESTWAKGEWTDDLLYALLQDEWLAHLHGGRTPAGRSQVGSVTRGLLTSGRGDPRTPPSAGTTHWTA